MRPRVLLVYANPAVTATPVPPYGLERIAQAFQIAGCEPVLLAPYLEPDPLAFLVAHLEPRPSLVGFSVRNIDDALVVRAEDGPGDIDTQFYLEAIRPLVGAAVSRVGAEAVVVGGTGVSAGPDEVRRYLGAQVAVTGPAEDLCFVVGRRLVQDGVVAWPEDARVVSEGRRHGPTQDRFAETWAPPPAPTPRFGPYLGLTLTRGGRVPIQISAGCDRRCMFCVESRYLATRVVSRSPEHIAREAQALARHGVRRIWLAGSELNVPNEKHALAVLKHLAPLRLDIAVFLQVAPVTATLLDALEDAGVDPTGLSFELGHLDDGLLRAGAGPANLRQIEALVDLWIRRGYRTLGGSVLFGAHPLETEATVERAIGKALSIDAALPAGLGLVYACGGRVYPQTGLADWVRSHPDEARADLYGATRDLTFTEPVVFSRPWSPRQLLRVVKRGLSGARGAMGPMNAEATHAPEALRAEVFVNRGIWRVHEDRPEDARRAFESALESVPAHLEALAQLGLLLGNTLGDLPAAADAFRRLGAALPAGDPRQDEVARALQALAVRS